MNKLDLANNLIESWLNSLSFIDTEKFHFLKNFAIKYYEKDVTPLLEINKAICDGNNEFISSYHNISYSKKDSIYYFTYENNTLEFSHNELKNIIRDLIDLLDKIYPIGTLVELKKEHMKQVTQNRKVNKIEVVIVSRFIFNKESKNYFTYAGVVYPVGLLEDAKTIQFTPSLIEKVVHEGYSDEKEDAYIYLAKKELIIDKKIRSFMFASEEEYKRFKEITVEENIND